MNSTNTPNLHVDPQASPVTEGPQVEQQPYQSADPFTQAAQQPYQDFAQMPQQQPQQPYQPQMPQQPYQQQYVQQRVFNQPANSRVLAMLFYWGSVIGLIMGIVVADRSDPFIRHHLNQAFILFLASLVSMLLVPLFGLGGILAIVVIVFIIMGTVDAYHGDIKPLPIIGNWHLLK